jgi:hypothetical protein
MFVTRRLAASVVRHVSKLGVRVNAGEHDTHGAECITCSVLAVLCPCGCRYVLAVRYNGKVGSLPRSSTTTASPSIGKPYACSLPCLLMRAGKGQRRSNPDSSLQPMSMLSEWRVRPTCCSSTTTTSEEQTFAVDEKHVHT